MQHSFYADLGGFNTQDGTGGGAGGVPFKDNKKKGIDTAFVKRERGKTGSFHRKQREIVPSIRKKDKRTSSRCLTFRGLVNPKCRGKGNKENYSLGGLSTFETHTT